MDFPRDQDARQELMYKTQLRTNELLEQLIQLQTNKTVVEPIKTPVNRATNKQTNKPVNKNQPRGKAK
jgi:hypothetical protein